MALPPQGRYSALAKQEEGIEAAVGEGVDETGLRRKWARMVRDVVEVALRIRRIQINRWRQHAVLHSEHCRSDLEGGSRTKRMTHDRLRRANRDRIGGLTE